MQQNERVAISAIAGMGGVGKTELALQYAWQHIHGRDVPAERLYTGGICWLQARDLDLGTQIVAFARAHLQLHPPEDLELSLQVAYCWRHWLPGEVLVVLDDVTDYQDVKPHLPPVEPRFKVLMTTRVRLGPPIERLDLDVLTLEAALALLKSLIGDKRVEAELDVAEQLCQWLGNLPLGLELVEDLKKARRILVQFNLIKRTEKETYQLHQLIREFFGAKREKSAEKDDLERGFCQAMVAVAKEIPERPTLKQVTAVTPAIPHLSEAATAQKDCLSDEDSFWPFFSLGKFYEGQGAYDQALPWFKECLSTTRERLGQEHPAVVSSLNNLAGLYYSQGRYNEAEPLYIQALALRKRRLGEEHPDVAASLNNLAGLYNSQGRYNEAEPLLFQALELRKQLLGQEHPAVALSLNNLAYLYYSQGRYNEAEPLYIQALEVRKQLASQEHPLVALSLNNLAALYSSQGRYNEAELLYLQALELHKQLLGQEHPDVARCLNNLALLYYSQGRYDEAEPLYLQALEIAEQRLGANHPNTITFRENLQNLCDARTS